MSSRLITKYFTDVSVKFNPFTPAAKSARIFLSRMPSNTRISSKLLNSETDQPEIVVTFKDKLKMTADPSIMSMAELGEYFNTHSRKLEIKDAIQE